MITDGLGQISLDLRGDLLLVITKSASLVMRVCTKNQRYRAKRVFSVTVFVATNAAIVIVASRSLSPFVMESTLLYWFYRCRLLATFKLKHEGLHELAPALSVFELEHRQEHKRSPWVSREKAV